MRETPVGVVAGDDSCALFEIEPNETTSSPFSSALTPFLS